MKHLIILIGVGVLARLAYNFSLPDSIFLGNYAADSLVLHTWATKILAGETLNVAFFRAPFYPYLLAQLYRLFGVSPWTAIIFNNALGLLTIGLSYSLARRLFGSKVAFWSGLVIAVYPTLIYFEGETLITSLAVFLFTLSVYRLIVATDNSTWWNIIIVGLVIGLGAITRPTLLPLALLFPMILFVRRSGFRETAFKTLVMVIAIFVMILPVTLTNLINGGELVLISTQGGANFYIGNSKIADGLTVRAPGPNLRIGDLNDNIWTSSIDEAEYRTGKKLTQSEVSSFWFREAFSEMSDDFGRTAGLFVKKFYFFWHGCEVFNHKPMYFAGEQSLFMQAFVWTKGINFPSGILFPMMLVGMYCAYRDRKSIAIPIMAILLFSVVVAAFFVCARFRQPVIPLATIFAVYALIHGIAVVKNSRKEFAIGLGAVLLLVVGLNWGGNIDSQDNRSQYHSMIGTAYLNRQNYESGIEHLRKSLEYLPENAPTYEMIGQAYLQLGDEQKAARAFTEGLIVDSTYPTLNFRLAMIAGGQNRPEDALRHLRLTMKHAPAFTQAWLGMASIFDGEGRYDSALVYYRKLMEIGLYEGEPARQLGERIRELSDSVGIPADR